MTTKELLKKIKKIELRTKGLSNQVFSGTYRTTFKGRGMSFSEVRQYQYGDDVRNIDWNVTARTNEPYVKVFEEERELTFMLIFDVSASAFWGTRSVSKHETQIEIAATLAFSAIANNDKVGAIFFSDKVEKYIPPKKGKGHCMRIMWDMIHFKPSQKKSSLKEPLKFLTGTTKKRCTAFILSDFMFESYDNEIKIAANLHDTIGIHVTDPAEKSMPNLGLIPVLDVETNSYQWIDTASRSFRDQYKKQHEVSMAYFKKTFVHHGADTLSLEAGDDYLPKLLKFFKER